MRGNGSRIAVIGEGMDRVRDVASGLHVNAGTKVDIFRPSSQATDEWNTLSSQFSGLIPDDIVKNTTLYKENKEWIKNIGNGDYTVVDIGAKSDVPKSTFYRMESKELQNAGK